MSVPASGIPTEAQGWIREFLDALRMEEQRLKDRMALGGDGIVMRIALTELDLHEHLILQESDETKELARHFLIAGLGLRRLIAMMLELHPNFTYPAITMRRSERLARSVLDLASELGVIEHGRRNVEAVYAGISMIHKLDDGSFRFELPPEIVDAQAHERSVEHHYTREFYNLFNREVFESDSAKSTWAVINKLMLENVYIFRDHFVGYTGDELIDEAFFTLAWRKVQATPQYDSFNERKLFGGIPYLKYLLASAIVVSFSLKHERFVEVLQSKHPDVLVANVLSISCDREGLIDDIQAGLDKFGATFANYTKTTKQEAEQIFNVISLTRSNNAIASRPYPPLPVFIEFADSSVVKLICGRERQMEFMLESLKKSYSRDYSANQRSREASMQRALTELMAKHFPGVLVRPNVNLRIRGKVLTDVDLAVFDPEFGDLILFQLKFQDCHGVDIKAGNSRMSRFLSESISWLDAVKQWPGAENPDVLRNAFRLPRNAQVMRVRKLIIARHHAYPLASILLDDDVAFGTWIQLFNACEIMRASQGDFRSINGLFALLRRHIVGAEVRYYQREKPALYRLGEVEFEVV